MQVTIVSPDGKMVPEAGKHWIPTVPEQLSVAVAVNVTCVEHPLGETTVWNISLGQVTVGGCLSTTVTVNEQVDELLQASVAVQFTIF